MADKLALGRVTEELEVSRFPDVRISITVPRLWMVHGGQLVVALPRLAQCDACRGGGCDACAQRGAFTLVDREFPRDPVAVQLPPQPHVPSLAVRLPHQGVQEGLGRARGHLLIEVRAGAGFSPGVRGEAPSGLPATRGILLGAAALLALIALLLCMVLR